MPLAASLRAAQERLRAVAFDDLIGLCDPPRGRGPSPVIRWPISSASIAWGSCPFGCGGAISKRLAAARSVAGRRH